MTNSNSWKLRSGRRARERGSALILCLLSLALVAAAAIFFTSVAERTQDAVLLAQRERKREIEAATAVAHKLNAIAINNRLILAALALAKESWHEATQWSVLAATTSPYWEASDWSVGGASTGPSQKETARLFSALSQRSARGFLAAQSLAESNRRMVLSLSTNAPQLAHSLVESTPEAAFCLAVSLVRPFQKGDLFPFSLPLPLPEIQERECKTHLQMIVSKYPLFDFRREISLWRRGNPHFGITIPSRSRGSTSLVADLVPQSRSTIKREEEKEGWADPLAGGAAAEARKAGVGSQAEQAPLPIRSGITHRLLRAAPPCTAKSVVTPEQWQQFARCGPQKEDLLRAFLTPSWTPFLERPNP